MPIYNGIEFIDESVSSILNQTYDKWELIVGINGHTENSIVFNIAKKYNSLYSSKIKVIDFYKIKGKANTLNKMLLHCNYDYIALLDVDDIWHPNKLEIQSNYLNTFDIIGSRCVYFGDINEIIPNIPIGDISNFNFLSVNPIINSSSIIKKELCYWDDNIDGVEDYDMWLRLKEQSKKFYNCSEVLVKHRIHQTSAFNAQGNNLKVDNLIKKYTYN